MKSRRWGTIAAVTFAVITFVVMPLIGWLARVWTDYQWFVDLGQSEVFVTRIVTQLAVGTVFALLAFVVLFSQMLVARRMAPRAVPIQMPEGMPPQVADLLDGLRRRFAPWLDRAVPLLAAWLAFLNGAAMAAKWETFRIALSGARFGEVDPQFGRDIGFFMFSLPAHEAVSEWLTGILVLAAVLAIIVHVLDGAIQPWARLRGFAPHVKAHLSVLMAAIVLSRAYAYWIDIWNLSFSPRGQVTGASYTDVHAQIPAYNILIVLSVLTAIALVLNIRYRGWRLPLIALGVWVAGAFLVAGVYPSLVQRYRVEPNEVALEAPFIERNIKMTRRAFGLSDVEAKAFPATEDLTAADVRADQKTLENVRLWDPEIAARAYTQLQAIRSYYDFKDVDVDRYRLGGIERQVLVSAREMNSALLDDKAQNWVNRHLVYTHGFGLVMSPVNAADARGLPQFVLRDVPTRVSSSLATGMAGEELKIDQPRIYFGEDTTDYVIVGTARDEFDYPQGDTNAMYRYEADRGPRIGSLFSRIAWALRLGSSQVFFSGYVDADSRVLMHRDLITRLDLLAPWLRYEDDPYPVLVDGKMLWVIDAYTASNRYPYSERQEGGFNYLRNSVKVTVDAYTGETTFYAFDPNDPVLKAWRDIFPSLITDAEKIPPGVREHFRYPQGLFMAQAEVYRTYHMTNVDVFYNKEDQWETPGMRQGRPMEPFFVLLRLPGAEKEHFYLMQPYTPRGKDNMIGWMAASSDPENYGERTVFQFPKERAVLGPEQVMARIKQDTVISPQITLWDQRGSGVLFGNMLVIPIKESIVYIQPLFLQADESAIPELARIIVVYGDKVEMQDTLEEALLKVFGQEEDPGEATGTPQPGTGAGGGANAAEASRLFERAIAAQRNGDWAEYGRLIEELGRVLDELTGQEATTTP